MKRKLFIGALLASCLLISGTLVGCTTDSGVDEPTLDGGTQDGDGDTTTPDEPVVEEDPSITLSIGDPTLYLEETTTITATVTGLEEYQVVYEITNGNEYITLGDDGLVTAVAVGEATVTGTVSDGSGETYSDTITIEVVELDEHIETLYSTLASFDYETGVYIEGLLDINLGTLNAGTFVTNYDFSVSIPLEATFGYTSGDDMIAKISIDFRNIGGLSIPITVDLSEIYQQPAGTLVTTVYVSLDNYIKLNYLNNVFTDLDTDELEDIEVINIYNIGTTDLYIEVVGGANVGSSEDTLGLYVFDLSGLFGTLDTASSDKLSITRGDVADIFDILLELTDVNKTETSYSLSVSNEMLVLLNTFYKELGIGGDYSFEFDAGEEAASLLGSSTITLEGLTIPEEFTDITLTINNDDPVGDDYIEEEQKYIFNNLVVSISGKTETTESFEFLKLTVKRPSQLEDDTVSKLKSYVSTLIDTYLE